MEADPLSDSLSRRPGLRDSACHNDDRLRIRNARVAPRIWDNSQSGIRYLAPQRFCIRHYKYNEALNKELVLMHSLSQVLIKRR